MIDSITQQPKSKLNQTTTEVGQKFDEGKARWDLIDFDFLNEFVEVISFGASKYGDNSWKKVPNKEERYFAALIRHIVAYRRGEKIDAESGKTHLAHAVCNLMFLFGDKE